MPEKEDRIPKSILKPRLEKRLLQGVTDPLDLSLAFGEKQVRIEKLIDEIHEDWLKRDAVLSESRKAYRVRQMDMIGERALRVFDQSTKPKKDTSLKDSPCGTCAGKGTLSIGMDDIEDCPTCGGRGRELEKVTKVTQSDGNPAFLKLAQSAFLEAGKIEGIYPEKSDQNQTNILIQGGNNSIEMKQKMQAITQGGAGGEALIRANASLLELKQLMNSAKMKKSEEVSLGSGRIKEGEEVTDVEDSNKKDDEDEGKKGKTEPEG